MSRIKETIRLKLVEYSSQLFVLSLVVRVILIVFGAWQDENFEVKYSDIDYAVVTDGARLAYNGESPYDRTTYRYTPLLAYLLIPNVFFPSFGKCIFVMFDLISAWLVRKVVLQLGHDEGDARIASLAWLYNPLSLTISTRGSGDSIVCAQVLFTLYGLIEVKRPGMRRDTWAILILSALSHGISVHWRIFPIIFAPTILYYLDNWPQRIAYGIVSGGVFLVLNVIFYIIYGQPFLQETFLYHLSRTDHRHNFSVWFYSLYLALNSDKSTLLSLSAFLPQIISQLCLILRFGRRDIGFCFFLQIWAFVVFNKVVTAQYFLWYISLLPIAVFSVKLSIEKLLLKILLPWMVTEIHWLIWGFQVEFLGNSAFLGIFFASVLFFIVNIYVITQLIAAHSPAVAEKKQKKKAK